MFLLAALPPLDPSMHFKSYTTAVNKLPFDWQAMSMLTSERRIVRPLNRRLALNCDWEELVACGYGKLWSGYAKSKEALMNHFGVEMHHSILLRFLSMDRLQNLCTQLYAIADQLERHIRLPKFDGHRIPKRMNQLESSLRTVLGELDKMARSPRRIVDRGPPVLPPEIWSIIRDHFDALVEDPAQRVDLAFLSALSYSSQAWSRQWRAKLFRSLILRRPDDLHFLRTILCSNLSGWLANAIESLTITSAASPRLLTSISGFLSSLKALRFTTDERLIFGRTYEASSRARPTVRLQQPTLRYFHLEYRLGTYGLCSLVELKLSDYRFPYFTSLLRFISALPKLESLGLTRVFYSSTINTGHLPSLNAEFASIRHIYAKDCLPCWPLVWIIAAPTVGYRYKRRRNTDVGVAASDIPVIVSITKLLITSKATLTPENYLNAWLQRGEEGMCASII